MGEEHAEILVHLIKRGQQALAPFSVQIGNSCAERFDRLFQICLFQRQVVMFFLNLFCIFLGAQVDGTQGIPLTFQAVYIGIDLIRGGHCIRIGL